MELDLSFVREKVLAKELVVQHTPDLDQWAVSQPNHFHQQEFSFS